MPVVAHGDTNYTRNKILAANRQFGAIDMAQERVERRLTPLSNRIVRGVATNRLSQLGVLLK
jgi:hypothetical protein